LTTLANASDSKYNAVEDAVVWFAVYGSNINLDDDNHVTGMVDAKGLLTLYRALCEIEGKNCDKVIVLGE
jgi:hypothetical protein